MKKRIVVLLCSCMVAVLVACSNGSTDVESSVSVSTEEKQESVADEVSSQEQDQTVESDANAQTDSFPEIWIHADIPQYKGLSYQTYKAMTGLEAEVYHAEFYAAYIEKTNVTAHFKATGFDSDSEMAVLTDEDIAVRLEGSLSTFFAGSYDVMTVDTFIDMISWHGGTETEYQTNEGDGTLYYIADKYLTVRFDSDGDGVNDAVLDVALDDAEQINSDSVVWLYLDDSQY